MQNLIVALIVAGAACYASWTLMPAVLRQRLALRLLPLAPRQAWLQKAARQAGGCGGGQGGGEGGCAHCGDGGGASPARPQVQPIKIHRR